MHTSVQKWIRVASLLLLASLSACGGGSGSTSSANGADAAQTVNAFITSTNTGQRYGMQIYLPQGYATSTKRYPVIYAMDGRATDGYERYAVLMRVLNQTGYNNVILVAMDSNSGLRRYVDFAMPGAQAYYAFLTTELIPMIDAQYRTDPTNRTLSGHSLSAEFALFALYQERPDKRYFSAFISADCSCWLDSDHALVPQWNVPITMEQQMFERSPSLPVKLVMSGDMTANFWRATDVYQRITQHGYQGLSAQFTGYNLGHSQMDEPAFGNALKFIFGPPPAH